MVGMTLDLQNSLKVLPSTEIQKVSSCHLNINCNLKNLTTRFYSFKKIKYPNLVHSAKYTTNLRKIQQKLTIYIVINFYSLPYFPQLITVDYRIYFLDIIFKNL